MLRFFELSNSLVGIIMMPLRHLVVKLATTKQAWSGGFGGNTKRLLPRFVSLLKRALVSFVRLSAKRKPTTRRVLQPVRACAFYCLAARVLWSWLAVMKHVLGESVDLLARSNTSHVFVRVLKAMHQTYFSPCVWLRPSTVLSQIHVVCTSSWDADML